MGSPSLPPVPIPLALRWRQFCKKIVPMVVFAATVVAIVLLWKTYIQSQHMTDEAEGIKVNFNSISQNLLAGEQSASF